MDVGGCLSFIHTHTHLTPYNHLLDGESKIIDKNLIPHIDPILFYTNLEFIQVLWILKKYRL